MEGDHGAVGVVFLRQKGLQPLALQVAAELLVAGLDLGQQALVAFVVGHLDEGQGVFVKGDQLFIAGDLVLQLLDLLQDLLAVFRIVPEIGGLGLGLQLLDLLGGGVEGQGDAQLLQLGLAVVEAVTDLVVLDHNIALSSMIK